MASPTHQFFLVIRDESTVVHEEELDFNALIHDVTFSAVCTQELANDGRWEPIRLEPELANGTVTGVTVHVAGSSRTYGRAVFKDRADEVLRTRDTELLRQAGLNVSWDIEVRSPQTSPRRDRARVSIRRQPYPFADRRLAGSVDHQEERGADAMSVRVAADLVEELRRESANSLDHERADFLVGDLLLTDNGHVIVSLIDRIPAETETEGSLVHVSFSPRTFHAAQEELDRRGAGHVILGHHHNHPPSCGRKCLMTIPACATDNVFFSIDDRVVHRSAFSRPYMVALVSGKGAERRADDPVMKAYGWRRGRICEKAWAISSRHQV
jgi:hypothetical protein